MSYFLVVRDSEKKTKEVLEFPTFEKARKEERRRYHAGHQGELVLGSASSLEEFLGGHSEYDPN